VNVVEKCYFAKRKLSVSMDKTKKKENKKKTKKRNEYKKIDVILVR